MAHSSAMRERFEAKIFAASTTSTQRRRDSAPPGLLERLLRYVEGESLIMGIKDLAVSSGSACTSASLEPSHVLRPWASATSWPTARSASASAASRPRRVDFAAEQVIDAVKKLRELSPLYEMVQEGIDLSTIDWTGH